MEAGDPTGGRNETARHRPGKAAFQENERGGGLGEGGQLRLNGRGGPGNALLLERGDERFEVPSRRVHLLHNLFVEAAFSLDGGQEAPL